MVLVERRTGYDFGPGSTERVRHAVYRSCQRAGGAPVAGLGADYQNIHYRSYSKKNLRKTQVLINLFI